MWTLGNILNQKHIFFLKYFDYLLPIDQKLNGSEQQYGLTHWKSMLFDVVMISIYCSRQNVGKSGELPWHYVFWFLNNLITWSLPNSSPNITHIQFSTSWFNHQIHILFFDNHTSRLSRQVSCTRIYAFFTIGVPTNNI